MKREQFIRQLSKDAKAVGVSLVVDMARGKGGHCVVRFGTAFSIIKVGRDHSADGEDHPQAVGPLSLKGE